MLTRWYVSDGTPVPAPVKCKVAGYPNTDEHGRIQYDNTHFDDEAAAWNQGRASVDAWVSLSTRDVEQLRAKLAAAERQLADAMVARHDFREAERKRAAQDGESP